MRLSFYFIFPLFLVGNSIAQAPAVLQWQKTFGGSRFDLAADLIRLPDGSFAALGQSNSDDGDIRGNHGPYYSSDICVLKFDAAGNLLWQKSYGGISDETGANLIATSDGGFIFTGSTKSNDGDVSGNHGPIAITADVWVVKLDASGNIQWQKCYGGSKIDIGSNILEISGGGYMVTAVTGSYDGDVTGHHGVYPTTDLWVLRIDWNGNIIWKRCYGGSNQDGVGIWPDHTDLIRQTADGNFVITTMTMSTDGDVTTPLPSSQDLWVLKINGSGTILWNKAYGGDFGDRASSIIVNTDGSIFISGFTYSKNFLDSYPGNGLGDGWVIKLDAAGNLLWMHALGGTDDDKLTAAVQAPDGGYILAGETQSSDGLVCKKHLLHEVWIVKLDALGNTQWSRTFGGNKDDRGREMVLNPAGEAMVIATAFSSDGDLTDNKGFQDLWLSRYSFTGQLIYPSVSIVAETDSIVCAGKQVYFVATPVKGGTDPKFQWKLNGVNTGPDDDTIRISGLKSTDVVTCLLTSNDPCVDVKTVTSNSLSVKVGPLPPPKFFLPPDTILCSYEKVELKPNRQFVSYLWSTGVTAETIVAKQPGLYWLDVVDRFGCTGRDTTVITRKPCIEGVFFPNSFTPNRDGRNDRFTPLMLADVKSYHFRVYDRWGRLVFESSTIKQGWDGTLKDMPCERGVYVWQCDYQLEGEAPVSKRGTVLLLR